MCNPVMTGKRKRIMVVGQPGSGKSTLARRMGKTLELPVVHIDHIHWQSGWVERSGSEKNRLCAEVHARDTWIFEGGRSVTWPERLDRADTLVWLDFPLTIRAWRVFWRTVRHLGRTRPDLPDGCPEQFSQEFTRWIWSTRNSGRLQIQKLFDTAPAGKEKYRLRRQRDIETLISKLSEQNS